MKKQAFQKATIRDSEGNIIQTGAYDVETEPLVNGTHDGTLNYMVNNLEALNDRADNSNTTLAKRTAVHLAYVDGDLALVEE